MLRPAAEAEAVTTTKPEVNPTIKVDCRVTLPITTTTKAEVVAADTEIATSTNSIQTATVFLLSNNRGKVGLDLRAVSLRAARRNTREDSMINMTLH